MWGGFPIKTLDLFSGIGGFALGLESVGFETVAFCERDLFCQAVLKKHWPDVPIHSDITELNGYDYRGTVELVCGGFPCQPFSVAGKRRGAEDDRALWPEMLRVIREVQPTWVIGENVTGIIAMELDTVLSDLEGEGYACQAFVLPACAVDAPHRRDRVWVVADAQSKRMERNGAFRVKEPQPSTRKGLFGCDSPRGKPRIWESEPSMGRVADGVPNRTHRLKSLGNAVVPQVVAAIAQAIIMSQQDEQ